MRGRHPEVAVGLTDAERLILESWARERRGPRSRTERAALLLRAAAGENNTAIGRAVGLGRETVGIWRKRWQATAPRRAEATADDRVEILDAILADAPRSGAPGTFTPEQIAQIIAVACEDPAADSQRPVSHWTPRELTDEVLKRRLVPAISVRHVGRILDFGRGRSETPPQPVLADAST